VIVVNMNYRLGPFGFLALNQLQQEDPTNPTTGLYGLQDQRAALQWVQRNIAAFGGDPTQVTIFGESAGAISICAHLAAPKSANLFHGALMESGFCTLLNLSLGIKQGNNLAGNLSCMGSDSHVLACLRSKSTEEVFTALPHAPWSPVMDGYEFTAQPIAYLQKGKFNKVPLLMGNNKNEDSLFLCPGYANISSTDYEHLVTQYFGKLAPYVLNLYPVSNYPIPVNALVDLFTDYVWICPAKLAAEAVTSAGVPTFLYSFEYKPSFSHGQCLEIAHSYELPFLFEQLSVYFHWNMTSQDRMLSAYMRSSWTNFAKQSSPSAGSDMPWPKYTPDVQYEILDVPRNIGKQLRDKYCSFWNQMSLKMT